MFNFGNDDKEKLRDNMEQIKELVNKGSKEDGDFGEETDTGQGLSSEDMDLEGADGFQDSFDDSPEQSGFDEPSDQSQQEPQDQGKQSFDSGPEPQRSRSEPDEGLKEELDEFEEKFGKEEKQPAQPPSQEPEVDKTEKPSRGQRRSSSKEDADRGSSEVSQLTDEVPSPPETKEIDVPEIDRGPLFLRQKKFLRAKQMIEEMLYLAEDMERTVNDLEAGIKEDQEIEHDVRGLLKEFEDNRGSVEDIISPREE